MNNKGLESDGACDQLNNVDASVPRYIKVILKIRTLEYFWSPRVRRR